MKKIVHRCVQILEVVGLKRLLLAVLICVAFVGTVGTFYFHAKYRALKANPNVEVEKETKVLMEEVGKLIELPANETPTIAIISNKEKLREQPFFKAVENGDVLIAFTKSMKAVLYRPSTNKIIEVGPININGEQIKTSENATGTLKSVQ